jgi:PAS domain S-box-containing protein
MDPIESREQLYKVFADSDPPIEQRIQHGLDLGTDFLNLPIGFVTRIEHGTQEIVHAFGDHDAIRAGESCPLDEAYCRRTIEIESPLAIQDASVSTAVADSAVELFGLQAYIGARIVVEEEVFGTICFAGTDPKDMRFSDAESYFVELFARLIGQALERQDHEAAIRDREEAVRAKEEVYRAVVGSSFDLVFQIDTDGKFTFMSDSVEGFLGYSPEYFLGQPFTSMLPDQEAVNIANEVYEEVTKGRTVEREFFRFKHRQEDEVLVDIRVAPIYSGEIAPEDRTPADIVGVQGMARDARGRQRRQRMLRVLNRVLRHNLRNDMNVIAGMADTLQERLSGQEADFARQICATSRRLMALGEVAQKLEENLETPTGVRDQDIVPIVHRVVADARDRYVSASIDVNVPTACVARSAPRIETALWELIDNASKHSGDGASIQVSVTRDESRVEIAVEDDGPGLPQQEREVLESGEETPLVHGSGLGLWLVHWIVESLEGEIQLRETEGTCIEISLRRGVDEEVKREENPL